MNDPSIQSSSDTSFEISKTRQLVKLLLQAPLSAKIGLFIIFVYIFVALFAPLIAPFGESELVGRKYQVWDDEFLLGTDNLGRDMLSRIIYGARNTVGIAVITTVFAFVTGGVCGIIAAVVGGWIDQLLSRVVDVLMAIPSLIFSMLLLSIFGTSVISLILIIGTLDAPRVFRISRAVSLNVVVMDFIEAAKLRGEKLAWISVREILPNIAAPLAAEFGLRFCFVFLTISALSFLGLGIQPPTADWGSMVRDTADLITFEDYTPLIPAAAIMILTIGVNFVVDWFLHKTSGLKDEY
jgi:peptide/nickel transport system permease protein